MIAISMPGPFEIVIVLQVGIAIVLLVWWVNRRKSRAPRGFEVRQDKPVGRDEIPPQRGK